MIGKLLWDNRSKRYFCSECRLKFNHELPTYCPFCGVYFSNYEETLIDALEKWPWLVEDLDNE